MQEPVFLHLNGHRRIKGSFRDKSGRQWSARELQEAIDGYIEYAKMKADALEMMLSGFACPSDSNEYPVGGMLFDKPIQDEVGAMEVLRKLREITVT